MASTRGWKIARHRITSGVNTGGVNPSSINRAEVPPPFCEPKSTKPYTLRPVSPLCCCTRSRIRHTSFRHRSDRSFPHSESPTQFTMFRFVTHHNHQAMRLGLIDGPCTVCAADTTIFFLLPSRRALSHGEGRRFLLFGVTLSTTPTLSYTPWLRLPPSPYFEVATTDSFASVSSPTLHPPLPNAVIFAPPVGGADVFADNTAEFTWLWRARGFVLR